MSDDPRLPIARMSYDTAKDHYELIWPTFEADGSVHFLPEDGDNHIRVSIANVSHYHWAVPNGLTLAHTLNSIQREKNSLILHKLELIVTDARVIFHGPIPKEPTKKYAGQLWFPWISTVGFRPKQSFLNEASISLHYREDFPLAGRGTWFEHVDLNFNKSLDTSALAKQIVERIVAFDLAHGAPDVARPFLEPLATPATLPDPAKGEYSDYHLPTYVAVPGGVPFVEWKQPIEWEWRFQNEAAKANDALTQPAAEKAHGDEPVADQPVEDEAAADQHVGSQPGDSEEPPTEDVASVSDEPPGEDEATEQNEPPLPTLGMRERLALAKDLLTAQRAFDAEKYDVAAPLYQRIVDRVAASAPYMTPAQTVDLLLRAAFASSECKLLDQAVDDCMRALALAARAREESLEFDTRQILAEVLDDAVQHPLRSENLVRVSELADAHQSRGERAESHEGYGRAFAQANDWAHAAHEFESAAQLFDEINDLEASERLYGLLSRVSYEVPNIEPARAARLKALDALRRGGADAELRETETEIFKTITRVIEGHRADGHDVALALAEDAVELTRAIMILRPGWGRDTLASRLSNVGELVVNDDPARAESLYAESLEIRRQLTADEPSDARLQRLLALDLWFLSRAVAVSDADRSRAALEEAASVVRSVADADAKDLNARRILAGVLADLGEATAEKDPAASLATWEECVGVSRAILASEGATVSDRRALNSGLRNLALACESTDPDRAAALGEELDESRQLVKSLESAGDAAVEPA